MENIINDVKEILKNDMSGHGIDHVLRVYNMAKEFAKSEKANLEIVSLIALLHDVDDYKIVGNEKAKDLSNAKIIMAKNNIDKKVQDIVIQEIGRIGYNKYLQGIRPLTLEGQIVSDSDMCDAIGANGILRAYAYSLKIHQQFFDKNIFPIENINVSEYIIDRPSTSVCHCFEKLLKLKSLMLTNSGQKEAENRHQFLINFLKQFFEEEKANDWLIYLDNYLAREQ